MFPVGVKYEDQPVSAAAYAAATSIDVLSGRSVRWRAREDGSSISQQVGSTEDLVHRLQAAFTSLEILAKSGHWGLERQRLSQLLANDLPFSLSAAVFADEDYWDVLVEGVTKLFERSEPWMWDLIPPQAKVGLRARAPERPHQADLVLRAGWRQPQELPHRRSWTASSSAAFPTSRTPRSASRTTASRSSPADASSSPRCAGPAGPTATQLEISGLGLHRQRGPDRTRDPGHGGAAQRLRRHRAPHGHRGSLRRRGEPRLPAQVVQLRSPSGFVATIDVADAGRDVLVGPSTWVVDVVGRDRHPDRPGRVERRQPLGLCGCPLPARPGPPPPRDALAQLLRTAHARVTAPPVWMDAWLSTGAR